MSLYLLIDILVILPTFLFSFEKRIKFYRNYPALFFSIFWVGMMYVFWDILATTRGDWSFNSSYILGIKFLGLPIEEILFFVVVPYSCFFIYEVIRYLRPDRQNTVPTCVFIIVSLLFLLVSLVNRDYVYTSIVMAICGLFVLSAVLFSRKLLRSTNYWLFILISFIPFVIVNYILTSLPVVVYNNEAIVGMRFLTIPVEDFFYSFSMLSFNFMVYAFWQGLFQDKEAMDLLSKKLIKT